MIKTDGLMRRHFLVYCTYRTVLRLALEFWIRSDVILLYRNIDSEDPFRMRSNPVT